MSNDEIAYLELFGITMAGVRKPDNGFYWTDLVGWWGLPDLRGTADNIPGANGRFRRTEYLRDSRAITLTGHLLTKTHRDLVSARDRLEDALSAGYGSMKVVTSSTGSWERGVEIDTLKVEPDHGREWTKFIVDMVAPDPRRYGPLQTVGPASVPTSEGGVNLPQAMPWNFGTTSGESRLTVPNPGTLKLEPVFRIEGGYSTVTLYDVATGKRLRLEWAAPEGSVTLFDMESRSVTINGENVTRRLTQRQWFDVPPRILDREFRFEVDGKIGDPLMWADYKIGAW